MRQLSPKAMRLIENALILQKDSRDHDQWRSWVAYSDTDLPPYVAQIALHALSGMALQLEKQVTAKITNDPDAAHIENDLEYISDIESALITYLNYPPSKIYG